MNYQIDEKKDSNNIWDSCFLVVVSITLYIGSDGSASGIKFTFLENSSADRVLAPTAKDWGPIYIPSEYYFVLGDNTSDSKDSRSLGYLNKNEIIEKIIIAF